MSSMSEGSASPVTCSPTMFGVVPECNVTFCVDTSGSMYVSIEAVKEDLIQALIRKANTGVESMFNIIEFNSEVTQWADKMVKCTPETVQVATGWIKNLTAKTGTNTLDALLTALSDPGCDAVYLVTDGLPDQYSEDILDHVGYAGQGRAVHCIYLCTGEPDTAAVQFLEDLATETYGSFHVVTLTTHGCVEKITPVYTEDHTRRHVIKTVGGTIHPNSKACSVSTTLQIEPEDSGLVAPRTWLANNPLWYHHTYPYWPRLQPWLMYRYHPQVWSRYRPARGWLKAQDDMLDTSAYSPSAGALIIGKKVLARKNEDGYFYLSSVKSQILSTKFLVGFGPTKHGRYKDTVYQETWVHDIIMYEDAKRHAIISGDKVLAPWEPEGEKFGPGTLIEGHEKREADGPVEDRLITVSFSHGRTETVPYHTAVWIPEPVYERIRLELQMPQRARESLEAKGNYPLESLPGYPTSGPVADPVTLAPVHPIEPVFVERGMYRHPDYVPLYPIYYKSRETNNVPAAVRSEEMNAPIPGTTFTQNELQDKIQSQLDEHRILLENKRLSDGELLQREMAEHRDLALRESDLGVKEEEIRRLREQIEIDKRLAEERKLKVEDRNEQEKEEVRIRELEQHKLATEERIKQLEMERDQERQWIREREREIQQERLLTRRAKQKDNGLRKSVTFEDEIGRRGYRHDQDTGYDSGHCSSPELYDNEDYVAGLPPEYRMFYPNRDRVSRSPHRGAWPPHTSSSPERRGRSSSKSPDRLGGTSRSPERPRSAHVGHPKQPWKYWKRSPSAPTYRPRSTVATSAPFRETMMQAPAEARNHSVRVTQPPKLEWPSSSFGYVDRFAKHNYNNSVGQLMRHRPQPPGGPHPIIFPDSEVGVALGSRVHVYPTHEDIRLAQRRAHVVGRQKEFTGRLAKIEQAREMMQDQQRQCTINQINVERSRQMQEFQDIQKTLEAKQRVGLELRLRQAEKTMSEQDREQNRIAALRMRRGVRETAQMKQALEVQVKLEQRQEIKVQRSQARWDEVHTRLVAEDQAVDQRNRRCQDAKVKRIQHFHTLETQAQEKKELCTSVTEQQMAILKSQVFP